MSHALSVALALGLGLILGWYLSGSAVVRVEPMVKCDVQKLYGDAWEACRVKGEDFMLSDTLGRDDPPKLVCAGGRQVLVPIKELGE